MSITRAGIEDGYGRDRHVIERERGGCRVKEPSSHGPVLEQSSRASAARPRHRRSRPNRTRLVRSLCWIVPLGLYALLALLVYSPVLTISSNSLTSTGGDTATQIWYLAALPHYLFHGHNPFFTLDWNFPYGANLAVNTSMPLLGLIGSPITLTLGPICGVQHVGRIWVLPLGSRDVLRAAKVRALLARSLLRRSGLRVRTVHDRRGTQPHVPHFRTPPAAHRGGVVGARRPQAMARQACRPGARAALRSAVPDFRRSARRRGAHCCTWHGGARSALPPTRQRVLAARRGRARLGSPALPRLCRVPDRVHGLRTGAHCRIPAAVPDRLLSGRSPRAGDPGVLRAVRGGLMEGARFASQWRHLRQQWHLSRCAARSRGTGDSLVSRGAGASSGSRAFLRSSPSC